MPDDRRLRLRRRLLALGLVPLALALALCLKVLAMLALDERGRGAFDDGGFDRAVEAFAVNGHLNLFETWVSPFDEGTAEHARADYPRAKELLETALRSVPAEQECVVRVNLALTLEALGDTGLVDGRRDLAEATWLEGIAVLDEGACRGDEEVGAAGTAARSVGARLADKLADREAADPEADPEVDSDPPGLEELERRNEEAQDQRRRQEEAREDTAPDEPSDAPPDAPSDQPSEGDGTPPSYSW